MGLLRSIADRLLPVRSTRRMLYRTMRQVLRSPLSAGHYFNATNLANLWRFHGRRFSCPVCGQRSRPLYDFPDVPLRLEHRIGILRETLQCANCLASMRQRTLALALLGVLNERWSSHLESITELASRGFAGLSVLDSDNFSAMSHILRACRGYLRCSYLPSRPWGAEIEPGYFNQDLQHLTFADASCDLVLTSDVMEHVRDSSAAHREIFRILRPGGAYVFTVPFDSSSEQDIRLVDTTTEVDVFLCKPQIHGDPLSCGALAYRVFGRQLIQELSALGFAVEFRLLQEPEHLVIDGDVFVARKPL